MTPRTRTKDRLLRTSWLAAAVVCGSAVQAQTTTEAAAAPVAIGTATATATADGPLNLRQVFEAAWARQPEALALQARRTAARAQQHAAKAWTPEPAALALSNKTDRLGPRGAA